MGGSVLGRGIIKGCPNVTRSASKVVGVDLGVCCIDDCAFVEECLVC
jgi:hypothetical protein